MVLSPGCWASKSISFPGTACLITMKNLNLEDGYSEAFVFQMNQQRLREGWRHGHHPGVHQRRSRKPGLLKPNSHTLPLAPQKLLLRELLSRKNHLMKVHQDHEKKKAANLWKNYLERTAPMTWKQSFANNRMSYMKSKERDIKMTNKRCVN